MVNNIQQVSQPQVMSSMQPQTQPPVQPVIENQTKQKPKKSWAKTLVIGCLIFLILSILCGSIVFFGSKYIIDNSEQSKITEELFTALDEGNKEKVEELVSPLVYDDFYKEYPEGTLASLFENNIENVTITKVYVESSIATVEFDLHVKDNSQNLENWGQVDMQQSYSKDGAWSIIYIGPKFSLDY